MTIIRDDALWLSEVAYGLEPSTTARIRVSVPSPFALATSSVATQPWNDEPNPLSGNLAPLLVLLAPTEWQFGRVSGSARTRVNGKP